MYNSFICHKEETYFSLHSSVESYKEIVILTLHQKKFNELISYVVLFFYFLVRSFLGSISEMYSKLVCI